jgi:hypothetical protein
MEAVLLQCCHHSLSINAAGARVLQRLLQLAHRVLTAAITTTP